MNNTPKANAAPPLVLRAATAQDLMMPDPVSIRADATVQEAISLLANMGFSAAPVIDDAGQPVGVLSRADILVHQHEKGAAAAQGPEYFARTHLDAQPEPPPGARQATGADPLRVRDLMTPVVFAVAPDTPAAKVVEELLALKIHRLFVVDAAGTLVGVISTLDIVQHLAPTP